MTEKNLLKLKGQIDEARQTSAELRGHLQALNKQLQEEWKCKDVDEAEALLQKMDDDIEKLDKRINEGLKELEEKYDK